MLKQLLLPVLFGLFIALATGEYFYYRSLRQSPEYALLQAAAAFQSHDLVAFQRYVDVPVVTSALLDDATRPGSALANPGLGSDPLLRGSLGLLKPPLAEAAQAEVRRLVETGAAAVAHPATPEGLSNLSLVGLFGQVLGPGSQFKGVKYRTSHGDAALVGLEFSQPRYDTTLVIEVKLLRQADGHWQVKQLTNTRELLNQVEGQGRKRLLSGEK